MAKEIKEKEEKIKNKKKAEQKENPIASFGGTTIDLTKFNQLSDKEQQAQIEKTLKDIYGDNLEVTKKHGLKVIRLILKTKDESIYLPYNLCVEKKGLDLEFYVTRKKPIAFGWLIFAIWAFVFALIAATYYGVRYMSFAELNKDIDGDGIADINIDIDNDGIAEINIDIDGDDKPDLNIDYKGDRMAKFNIDLDEDGVVDSNMIMVVVGDSATCNLNCDINGDGWPDTNLDLDGDGKADIDVDVNGDKIPDLNMDLNGNGDCDVMCDEDDDKKCDSNCIEATNPGDQTGSSEFNGDPEVIQGSSTLVINFIEGETVSLTDMVPDDQPFFEEIVKVNPYKTFTIENTGVYPVMYSLKWKNVINTFTSTNFKYMLESTNGGPQIGYTVAPTFNDYIARDIIIMPRVSQKFKVTFNLEGTNSPQNEDQGKMFQAAIDIEL